MYVRVVRNSRLNVIRSVQTTHEDFANFAINGGAAQPMPIILRPRRIHGGMEIGRDGKIHTSYTHNPSTLRLASQGPNLQNLPRATGQAADLCNYVRNIIVASPGCLLLEYDYSAIEAVLVGFYAQSPEYIRLAKLGIHAYLASHLLKRPADLKWSDGDLKAYFKEIKSSKDPRVIQLYNGSKRTVHLSAYGGTPRKMAEAEPGVFATSKVAAELQDFYFNLCPYVKTWQRTIMLQAEKDGFLRNPFDYVHRFLHVFRYEKVGGQWNKKPGDDANRALAFLPQSTAAAIIKEAMLRLYFDRFEEAGQWLRLQVHDSLVSDVPLDKVEAVGYTIKGEMVKPVPELRLPASYGMGEALVIDVDSKQGQRWGSCH